MGYLVNQWSRSWTVFSTKQLKYHLFFVSKALGSLGGTLRSVSFLNILTLLLLLAWFICPFMAPWYAVVKAFSLASLLVWVVVGVRPSLELKRGSYRLYYIFVIALAALGILTLVVSPYSVLFLPWIIFMVICVADERPALRNCYQALVRATKLYVALAPILLVVTALAYVAYGLICIGAAYCVVPVLLAVHLGGTACIGLVYVCILVNLYVQSIHEQFQLYYRVQVY